MIDLEISHEEYKQIVNEKEKLWIMKEGIRMIKSSDKSNKEEGQNTKTTEIRVKIGMYKIKKKFFLTSIKCL